MNDDDNINDSIALEHVEDQLNAATEETMNVAKAATNRMITDYGRQPTKDTLSILELINSYLLEDWIWFRDVLSDNVKGLPDHCGHVDPAHPAMWYGILTYPNKLWCQSCTGLVIDREEENDMHKCDRCGTEGINQFYDIAFPVGNILIFGSICEDCVEKTKK